jgi:hypothetical protein
MISEMNDASSELQLFMVSFSQYMRKIEDRLDKIEAFLKPQMEEQERIRRLEEEKQREVERLEMEKFKLENLVCKLEQFTVFPPLDFEGKQLYIPIEISLRFDIYNTNYGLIFNVNDDSSLFLKPITRKWENFRKYDTESVLLGTTVTIIRPNVEARKTWRGRDDDTKYEAKIISFPKTPTTHIGIKIKSTPDPQTWMATIFDMNNNDS